ncbi:MAG: hypothetical protein KME32_36400 [Mojavia pulchra JT2-VF2]|uniref:Uncharacterized protein n=1 Tax=Mojavia pulchra JT2-VF2 TaxID=287848 RepID=A0A951Q6H6_9NOST|nr:hypothetical protein [Mojavia pulchra JT2-VF2]
MLTIYRSESDRLLRVSWFKRKLALNNLIPVKDEAIASVPPVAQPCSTKTGVSSYARSHIQPR